MMSTARKCPFCLSYFMLSIRKCHELSSKFEVGVLLVKVATGFTKISLEGTKKYFHNSVRSLSTFVSDKTALVEGPCI
jgi:hypothetical protein